MKRLITILTASLALTSCQKFDDSTIWNKLNEQTSTLNSQESRIKTIEQQLARYNTDINAIRTT